MLNSVDKTKLKKQQSNHFTQNYKCYTCSTRGKVIYEGTAAPVTQREGCKMPPLHNQWHPWSCFLLSLVSAVGKCTFLIKSKLMLLWYFTLSFSLQHFLTLLNDGWLSLMGERQKKRERHIPPIHHHHWSNPCLSLSQEQIKTCLPYESAHGLDEN